MPNFCPAPDLKACNRRLDVARSGRTLSVVLILLFLFAASHPASAQTLARPGWAGSGLNTDPWWKSAVFYEVSPGPAGGDTATDLKAWAAKLDDLHALGVDALLIPMPILPEPPTNQAPTTPMLDDFDELIHQASRVKIRILLTLAPASASADLSAPAMFWLSRGVAGFHLVAPPGAAPSDARAYLQMVQSLRRITSAAVGQRIVLSDYAAEATSSSAPAATTRTRRSRAERQADASADRIQLQVDTRLGDVELPEAANLRAVLQETLGVAGDVLEFHPPQVAPGSLDFFHALSRPMAAMLLTLHSAAIISPEMEAPTAASPAGGSLPDWYRRLSALHHSNAALRYGSVSMLNYDEQNALAWVARPSSAGGLTLPVVVACNLSTLPVTLSLGEQLRALDLRGSFLRTLLRSDKQIGPQDVNSVTIPPFGVYIGELKR